MIWYCPQTEVLRDWFLSILLVVRRPDNSCYFSLTTIFGSIGPTSEVRTRSSLPGGVLGAGTGLSSFRDILLDPDGRLEQILCKNAPRGWFMARPEPGDGVSYLIVSLEDMVEPKPLNISSSFHTSCRYAAMRES
jgi:hypothetical protein